jgi:hypothetical protein
MGPFCHGTQAGPARVLGPTGLSARGHKQGSKALGVSTAAASTGFRQVGDEVGQGRWLEWHIKAGACFRAWGGEGLTMSGSPR